MKEQDIPPSLILQQVPLSHCLQPVNGGLPFRHCVCIYVSLAHCSIFLITFDCKWSVIAFLQIWSMVMLHILRINWPPSRTNMWDCATQLARVMWTTVFECRVIFITQGSCTEPLCNVHDWCLRMRNASWYYPPVRTAQVYRLKHVSDFKSVNKE